MKKENIMIPFESEQLAALDFSLKKKNTSVVRVGRKRPNSVGRKRPIVAA